MQSESGFGPPKYVQKNDKKLNNFWPKTPDENCQKLFHFLPEAVFEINQKCILSFYTSVELPLSTLQSEVRKTPSFFAKIVSRKNYLIICFFGFGTKNAIFSKKLRNLVPKKALFLGKNCLTKKLFNYLLFWLSCKQQEPQKHPKNPLTRKARGGVQPPQEIFQKPALSRPPPGKFSKTCTSKTCTKPVQVQVFEVQVFKNTIKQGFFCNFCTSKTCTKTCTEVQVFFFGGFFWGGPPPPRENTSF